MEEATPRSLACPRCGAPLSFAGTKSFHEGSRAWGAMGGVWELFENREALDAYSCPRCGRVEFFLAGVGEELRGQRPHDDAVDDDAVPLSLSTLGPAVDEDPGDDALPEWSCASCGEAVPGNFEVCWNCSTPRPSVPPE